MVMGNVRTDDPVMVRVHSENVTCDMFGSTIDDTGFQLRRALEKIRKLDRASFFIFVKASTAWT
jgi:3,4-dihydroxy 2-butanone 4-phosphate synthase/GTP cyclohydrolase II